MHKTTTDEQELLAGLELALKETPTLAEAEQATEAQKKALDDFLEEFRDRTPEWESVELASCDDWGKTE